MIDEPKASPREEPPKKPEPPSYLVNQSQFQEPFSEQPSVNMTKNMSMAVDVEIMLNDMKYEVVEVRRGDDASELAQSFCYKHGITDKQTAYRIFHQFEQAI